MVAPSHTWPCATPQKPHHRSLGGSTMQVLSIMGYPGVGQEEMTPDASLGDEGNLKYGRTGSSLQGGAGYASADPSHLFPTITSRKREREHSPARHRGGVRCSSLLRWNTQAIYSSGECKQTHPCPTVPISHPLPALALGHLVPAGGQAARPHCPRLGTDGQAPAGTGGHRLGTVPGTALLPGKTSSCRGMGTTPSPALRT